jgi:hypothetical protein
VVAKDTRTPTGRFQVIRKDEDHRSIVYGDYVDDSGRIVKANVDSRRNAKPPRAHFVGPTFSSFREATDCTKATCLGSLRRTEALECPTGKRASFITSSTLGDRWW